MPVAKNASGRRSTGARGKRLSQNGGFRSIAAMLREAGEFVREAAEDGEHDLFTLPDRLCRTYKRVALEEIYETVVEQTPYGPCLHLVDRVPTFTLELAAPIAVEHAVLAELSLIYGVGPVTAQVLRADGVLTLSAATDHARFGAPARQVLGLWQRRDLPALHDLIRQRLGPSGHALGLALGALADPGGIVIVDLETLGLSGAPVFLFGLAHVSATGLEVHQYLARAGGEEPAALVLALDALRQAGAIVTYNGRTADVPWLRQRAAYYGVGPLPKVLHLDLLHPTRHRYRSRYLDGSLPDFRLPTVERQLVGILRDMLDVPGAYVPYFYKQYEKKGNIGPLVPIIDHNRADLVGVARLLNLLSRDALNA